MPLEDTAVAAAEFETPFEGTLIRDSAAPERAPVFERFASGAELESPFLAEYWTREGEREAVSPAAGELVELLEQLWDQEFDELIEQVAQDASAAVEERFPEGEASVDPAARERFVRAWLEPLRREGERVFESFAEAVSEDDVLRLGEAEFEALLEPLEVGRTDLSPMFEDFLGGLLKKAKKLSKGAWKVAKKGIAAVGRMLPLGVLLGKLKAFVAPMLERVLRSAIGKLPADLRPAASQLAKRLLGVNGLDGTQRGEPAAATEPRAPASADASVIQQEFDLATASLLFAADETESELAIAELAMEAQNDDDATAGLDQARRRFVNEITRMSDLEDPTPAVQGFLPAVLPVAKLAIEAGGRDRVVGFLAPFVADRIKRYTGPESSVPLSRAIVDAGLRTLGLELSAEGERGAAAGALAATVEDTVHRLADLHAFELEDEDEERLANAASRAFEAAAVANMPPATLQPHLSPTAQLDGTWVLMPVGGAPRYKKYSRVLETRITPQIARQLTTFGGAPLETFVRDVVGATGALDARAHLYEAIPGTTLHRLAALERDATGPIRGGAATIHPLSTQAAGLLFREPGLGRDVSAEYLSDRVHIAAGQRFVRFDFDNASPAPPTTRARPSQVRVTIDLRSARKEIRLCLYLNESEAQRLAAQANRGANAATVQAALMAAVTPALRQVLSGNVRRRVRFVADGRPPRWRSHWLRRLNAFVPGFESTIEAWLAKALGAHTQLSQQLAQAAASERDGVTVMARFENVSGLDAAAAAAEGRGGPALSAPLSLGPAEKMPVHVRAGFGA